MNNSSGNQCESVSDNFCYQNNNNNSAHLNNKNIEHKSFSSEVNSRENSPEKQLDTLDDTSFSSNRNDKSPSPILHQHSDSIGSHSPENLTSSKSQSGGIKNHSVSDMLDHKLQLSFLGPPLAALHSMTEMKSQNSPKASQNSQCVTNPHGIDSILSRPTPVTSAHLNAALGKKN